MATDAPIELPEPRRGTGALRLVAEDMAKLAEAVRILDERQQMGTIRPSPGVRPEVRKGGTILGIDLPSATRRVRLPFECYLEARVIATVLTPCLVAAPGTISTPGFITGAQKPETVEEGPADGMWFFYASVTINPATGQVTATGVEWVLGTLTPAADTYYKMLAQVEIASGAEVDPLTQYDYGPVVMALAGGVSDAWTVFFF